MKNSLSPLVGMFSFTVSYRHPVSDSPPFIVILNFKLAIPVHDAPLVENTGVHKPGTSIRVPENVEGGENVRPVHPYRPQGHSRNSSLEMRLSASYSRSSQDLRGLASRGHSRAASLDLRHARNSSADLNKLFRNDLGLIFGTSGN